MSNCIADVTIQGQLFSKIEITGQRERPSLYYSNGRTWKTFLDSPDIKNKSWMELAELFIRKVETDEIKHGKLWIWIIDMSEQSLFYKVFMNYLPNMTRYFMKRWENNLIDVYIIRPNTITNALLKIIETILPKERLANLHRISGSILEIYSQLEKMGRNTEEIKAIHNKLL